MLRKRVASGGGPAWWARSGQSFAKRAARVAGGGWASAGGMGQAGGRGNAGDVRVTAVCWPCGHGRSGHVAADVEGSARRPGARRAGVAWQVVGGPAARRAQGRSAQDEVFEQIAARPIRDLLERFTRVAFLAFGATGGGKTFVVTGGAKRFADRGLIPRSISALFQGLGARADRGDFKVTVAFYELYKDLFCSAARGGWGTGVVRQLQAVCLSLALPLSVVPSLP